MAHVGRHWERKCIPGVSRYCGCQIEVGKLTDQIEEYLNDESFAWKIVNKAWHEMGWFPPLISQWRLL